MKRNRANVLILVAKALFNQLFEIILNIFLRFCIRQMLLIFCCCLIIIFLRKN